jgi:hypothetical protein
MGPGWLFKIRFHEYCPSSEAYCFGALNRLIVNRELITNFVIIEYYYFES